MKSSRLKSYVEGLFIRSSWTIFFILLCLIIYENNLKQYHQELNILLSRIQQLETKKINESELNSLLKLNVSSQDDPEWINIVLMEELGVIPEGQKKVLFKKKKIESNAH